MTATPATKKTRLQNRLLLEKRVCSEVMAARRPVAGAYQQGGVVAALWLILFREAKGIYSSGTEFDELMELKRLAGLEINAAEREEEKNRPTLEQRAEASHQKLLERSMADREAEKRRHLERCGAQPSGSPAVIKSECRVIRPSDQVVDQVLSELAAQGPSPEVEEESTPATEEQSSTSKGDYSRKRIGECGMRIGANIDMVLREIRGPQFENQRLWPTEEIEEADELKLHRSLDALLEFIRSDSSVDPPSKPLGAEAQGTDDTVAGRGPSDFTIPESGLSLEVKAKAPSAISEFDTSVWAKLTEPDCGTDCGSLEGLIDALDASPELRSASLLRSMGRYRDVLDALPSDAPIDTPLTVTAVDVLVLIKAVMSRLR